MTTTVVFAWFVPVCAGVLLIYALCLRICLSKEEAHTKAWREIAHMLTKFHLEKTKTTDEEQPPATTDPNERIEE